VTSSPITPWPRGIFSWRRRVRLCQLNRNVAYYRLHHRNPKAGASHSEEQAETLDGSVKIARKPRFSSFVHAVERAAEGENDGKSDAKKNSVDQSHGRIVVSERQSHVRDKKG
jgi:hypothetical protein